VPYQMPDGQWVQLRAVKRASRQLKSSNVIWKGQIDAWVRCEALRYARTLRDEGFHVLSVSADGLYVEGEPPFPSRPLWRPKFTVHNARFISDAAWVADESERLPGIHGKEREGILRERNERTRARARARVAFAKSSAKKKSGVGRVA